MADIERAAPPVGLTRSFTEPGRFASALFRGQFDYLPMREERLVQSSHRADRAADH